MTTHFLGDTATLTGRSLTHVFHSPDTIITTVITPIAMLLLFVYALGGAIHTSGYSGPYVSYLLPGILLITIASGSLERFQTMPVSRAAVLWAHVITSLVANAIALSVVIGVAWLLGFRSSASVTDWLVVVGILALFTLALTWLAVIPGLTAKTIDGASAFAYPLIFLPFISSAFVPTDSMPGPVRWFAEHQPVTPIVNSVRGLLTDGAIDSEIWVALAWCVGILAVAFAAATALYRRRGR